jgi:hypothetical protein
MLTPSSMNTSNMTAAVLNEHLAKGVPALSPATGRTSIVPDDVENFDMNTSGKPDGGAWGRSGVPYYQRWLHNDMREMAYFYTHVFFKKLVEEGELK